MSLTQNFIAANRFGYGANPATIKAIGDKPQEWLLEQLKQSAVEQLHQLRQSVWSSSQALTQAQQSQQKNSNDQDKQTFITQITTLNELSIKQGINSSLPFYWHLVDFFSNHFSVSTSNIIMRALAPTLDIEAIAPNIIHHFSDLLLAVESHPAMLHYLNNVPSIGPGTRVGQKQRNKGLNENLAREILELHTLGVKSNYAQNDVTELAKAITGWSVGNIKRNESAGFLFRETWHEPGSRQILSKVYKHKGLEQGRAIIFDLANHPDTAQHICTKLVQHFISDSPDPSIVQTMVNVWLLTQGYLPKVLAAMVQHPASWLESAEKLKTPRELVISVCRSCQITALRPNVIRSLQTLGQKPFNAGSPAGYKDVATAWSGPSAFLNRIEWVAHISRIIKILPEQLANDALGPLLRASTIEQIRQAESKQQALTLLLMSPEFQRR